MESVEKGGGLYDSCKELLMALDPNRALDQLECIICYHSVNSKNKPMIFCKNSVCVEKHTICANCLRDMIQSKRKKDQEMAIPQGQVIQLTCPLCKQAGPSSYHQDKNKIKISQPLEVILNKLKDIETNLKQISQQDHEKKMKEIVDRAEIDIFKSKSEATRKNFLFQRLKKRVQSSDKEMQKILNDNNEKTKIIEQAEESHRVRMQSIINEKLLLKKIVEQKTAKIEELQQQNQKLRQKLKQFSHIDKIETLVRQSPKRQNQHLIFNFGETYRQFKFRPMKDETFSQNFRETKPNYVIELKKEREVYLKAKAQLRQFHHRSFFSINDQNDQLICFKVAGLNPTTRRYKFGLMDKNLKEIKRACLLLDLGENNSDRTQTIIYFFINLVTRKLAGSMGQVKECWDIPLDAPLQKFTVYISFTDLQTQIKLD